MTDYQRKRFNQYYQLLKQHLMLQGLADKTIEGYCRSVRRLAEYFNCCPDKLTKPQLKQYFADLIASHSWSTVKHDRNGIQFFYKHVLNKQWEWLDIVKPPQVKHLPDILTQDEVPVVLAAVSIPCYRVFLFTVYSMGLRLGEALDLQVGDIDAGHHRIHIREGKGNKDRFVFLPDETLLALRAYWASHRNPRFLFPSRSNLNTAIKPMDRGGIQKAMRCAVKACGIARQITVHSLRHSYATHLLEHGVDLLSIQALLGHKSLTTTARYAQLTDVVRHTADEAIIALIQKVNWEAVACD